MLTFPRTKAWGESLDPHKKSGVRFLADASGEFNRQMDLLFSSAKVFGNDRSKRYALVVEDGKVVKAFVEPDNTSVDGKSSLLHSHPHACMHAY